MSDDDNDLFGCHWVACNVDAGGQRRENNDVCGSFRLWVSKVGTASSGGGSLCKWVCKVVFNPSGGGSLCKKLVNNFWQQNRFGCLQAHHFNKY
ncbi:putative receptor-type tyrosine-protein phosphatase O [Sesbania bispinosa]|nr:putative receptor-type tyrosine-protein phosphatase O [Sesbania bispinosa]